MPTWTRLTSLVLPNLVWFGRRRHDKSPAGSAIDFGGPAVLQQIERLAGLPRVRRRGTASDHDGA